MDTNFFKLTSPSTLKKVCFCCETSFSGEFCSNCGVDEMGRYHINPFEDEAPYNNPDEAYFQC